ncbi:DUF2183 domain-containing protein [Weeksellaceae bacterium TAE3-ERU29]|nr:DUF2183 domain-containing protein [Weeksellaceae bacterium TAE3-ERU29]
MFIKVYHSFSNQNKIKISGHVFEKEPMEFDTTESWFYSNIKSLIGLFRTKPLANVDLIVEIGNEEFATRSDENGFYELETTLNQSLEKGWNEFTVWSKDRKYSGKGLLFLPTFKAYGIISDIDDTVLKSYSATIIRRLYELISKNPNERKLFEHTVDWYKELAESRERGEETNPFFYVSSSEWNLYDYLNTVFTKHDLPRGIFLLNDLKSLKNFFKTGKTGHQGKFDRIESLLQSFPKQSFILIGDNTQKDPIIYKEVCEKYGNQIIGVFIRNKSKKNTEKTQQILDKLKTSNRFALQFDTTKEAMQFTEKIGLIAYEDERYDF